MLGTRVGYAGGHGSNPTYHDLDTHAEAVEVAFDAGRISYDSLLELFWAGHDPTRAAHGTQYRSALFCQDADQLRLAEASAERQARRRQRPIHTEIVRGARFFPAEAYHQKWYLRRHPRILDELGRHYAGEGELLASTAAARLNGFLGGAGTRARLRADLDRLGLGAAGRSYLEKTVGRWG